MLVGRAKHMTSTDTHLCAVFTAGIRKQRLSCPESDQTLRQHLNNGYVEVLRQRQRRHIQILNTNGQIVRQLQTEKHFGFAHETRGRGSIATHIHGALVLNNPRLLPALHSCVRWSARGRAVLQRDGAVALVCKRRLRHRVRLLGFQLPGPSDREFRAIDCGLWVCQKGIDTRLVAELVVHAPGFNGKVRGGAVDDDKLLPLNPADRAVWGKSRRDRLHETAGQPSVHAAKRSCELAALFRVEVGFFAVAELPGLGHHHMRHCKR